MLPRRIYWNNFFDDFIEEANKVDMKCDIYEKEGIYHIEADVPGLDKKDIEIEYDNGYLKISASKEEVKDEENKNYIKKERTYGRIERQFYVGNIDQDKIEANFNNGILQISVPKMEKTTKLIEIK